MGQLQIKKLFQGLSCSWGWQTLDKRVPIANGGIRVSNCRENSKSEKESESESVDMEKRRKTEREARGIAEGEEKGLLVDESIGPGNNGSRGVPVATMVTFLCVSNE
ncbi:hypothetical protein KQX54_005064 [Cotesia glomerata]|uniref:Uncharacterized protein n=1 Tax=Cotesia glomerata TaxID=32391 RepID=A0AAV7HVF0_COTGL|nr:hypothetical protein KQX54_005064 [Cotesia glomerata]